jgi:hypothetical protein
MMGVGWQHEAVPGRRHGFIGKRDATRLAEKRYTPMTKEQADGQELIHKE